MFYQKCGNNSGPILNRKLFLNHQEQLCYQLCKSGQVTYQATELGKWLYLYIVLCSHLYKESHLTPGSVITLYKKSEPIEFSELCEYIIKQIMRQFV